MQHVTRTGEKRHRWGILSGKPAGIRQLGKPGCQSRRIILKLTVKIYDMRVCNGSMFGSKTSGQL
jgi:hypothetical protein